ncbi:unnamed protein product [Pieris macdunnoughi]|uniref:Uncharacterized protein n=1 Tax=Pieris macdunnoughi TaxID=345717 RepID=A0A821SA97_9NEOP|nr:unnamed protein product [Pieris macdunnoughi]
MILFKIYAVALLVAAAIADKKIELEDIEEDNLKSERQTEYEKERPQGPSAVSAPDLGYLKNNFIQYYDAPSPTTQHPRYVQQYAVTESPEAQSKPQYDQHQPVGYISNVPMLYIVPQYYNEQIPQAQPHGTQYAPSGPQNSYPTSPEQQQQQNYVVPTFITPTGNAQVPRFIQPYTTPVAFIGYPQPTLPPPQPSASPPQSYQTYQSPIANYQTALVAPPFKNYQQINHYSNSIDQNHGQGFSSQAEGPYVPHQEYPRYYNSRAPVRDDYRTSIELPHPSPLLLKPSPPHLSHIPKALPTYRPLSKPIYATSGPLISTAFTPKPAEAYGVPFKRRPTSLLESYIPSSVQLEYLKRGYTKNALSTYEALSSGRGFPQVYPTPRYYERGFLPNQMYHTAAGGVTFGQHKRAPKLSK